MSELPDVEQAGPGSEAALAPQLIDLQRVAGNSAVSQLLQRQPWPHATNPTPQPAPKPGPTTGGPTTAPGQTPTGTTQPAATPASNPLSDTRIKWIEELPTLIKLSIDSVGDDKLKNRVRAIDESLARQRAAIDAAKTADDKKAATEKMAKSDDMKAKEEIDKVWGKKWAMNRLALMDYLGCTLGNDAGVERYYKSLVQFGSRQLYVHPEAARRLIRVRDELDKEKIPMPTTDNGFALRGRHIHPTKQDKHPGMMTHSLGVAVDWEAYKNVHILDEQLMHLITAVTGRAHNIELPSGAMSTLVALGEKSMGNKLTADQEKALAAKGDALIETVGKEFDRLEADSDMFRDSLKKDDILALHRDINPVLKPLEAATKAVPVAQAKLAQAQKRKDKGKDAAVAAAQLALKNAQDELAKRQADHDKKMADNKKKLEELFKPWLDALKKASEATVKEAEPLLKGKKLDAVLTKAGLESREKAVAGGTAAVAKELGTLVNGIKGAKGVKGTVPQAQGVRNQVAAAQAYLAKSGTEQEKTAWAEKLTKLEARAGAVVGRGAAAATEALVLRGASPWSPAAAPVAKPRKPKWEKEFPSWEADIAKHEAAMDTAEATLKTTTGTVPADAVKDAYKLRDDRAASEEIRKQVGKADFEKLQAFKVKAFHLDRAAYRLLNDASFMFQPADVRNPGVAQLTGTLDVNAEGKKAYLGGGGFFGTPTREKEAAAKVAKEGKGTAPTQSGFAKRFFQTMVKYGFEPAAQWRTADSMHFQVRGLVDAIVPADACVEPPKDAEEKTRSAIEKAKTDKEKAKLESQLTGIAGAREKAAKERAAGEAYSTGAEAARKTWAAEGGKK